MKKKIISMGLILFLLSGCWNYQEIQDFANVAGIAIDKGEEKKYKVSMEVISLDATTDFKPQTHVYESEDDTILGAGRSAISFVSKKLYYGHCKVIIISEELAREGISNLLDIFLRDHEFRITMLLFIAKGSSAKEMLEGTAALSDVASHELDNMVRRHMIFSTFSKKQSLYRVIGKILEEGVAPVIPILELIQVSEDEKTFNLAGMGCFRGDAFVNYLDLEETKYFLCLTDKYVAGFLTLELDSENFVGIEIASEKTKYKYEFNDNRVKFILNIDLDVYISEVNKDYRTDGWDEEKIVMKLLKEKREGIEETYFKIKQETKGDVLGYQKRLKEYKYKEWKKYQTDEDKFLEIVDIEVKVSATVRGSGKTYIGRENYL